MMSGRMSLGRFEGDAAAYNPRVARRLLAYLAPHKRMIAAAILLVSIGSGANVAGPLLLKIGIDEGIEKRDTNTLATVGAIYLLTLFVMWAGTYLQVRISATIGQASLLRLRNDLFAKLNRLSLSYFTRHPLGAVMSRLTNDVDVISEFVTMGVVSLVADVCILLIIVIMMFTLNFKLALVTMAMLPVMWLASRFFSAKARNAFRDVRSTVGDVYANLQESIDGVRVTQSFGRERTNASRFQATNQANVAASVRAGAIVSGFIPVIDTISAIATASVIVVGGSLVVGEEVTVGVLVAFIALVARFFQPIQQLTRFYNQLQSTMAAGEKIFELMDEPEEISDSPAATELPSVTGRVEFDNVTFAYEGTDVLRNVSFVAEPGQRIALVGPTGAGKTTIINLLARFYDADDGEIRVDGHPIRCRPAFPAPPARHRSARQLSLFRKHLSEHRLRTPGRVGAGSSRCRQSRGRAGLHSGTAKRLPNRSAGARLTALGRAAATDLLRPRPVGRSAHPDPGRGNLKRRRANRTRHSGGPGTCDGGPHILCDRASPGDCSRCGPDSCHPGRRYR